MPKSLKETFLLPGYAAIRFKIIELEKSFDPQAHYKLATLYLEIDEEKAVYYYRQAAEKGHHQAQYILGFCYLNGIGVAKDNRQALKWIEAAAMQGNADAQYKLAYFYATGDFVQKDQEKALQLFWHAVKQGSAAALTTFIKYYILIYAAYYHTINGSFAPILVNWNWREDFYDLQINSDRVNMAKLKHFKNVLYWLGSITVSEKRLIVASSYKQINEILISVDSPVRKTGMHISICRALLDGLQNNQFGKMAPYILSYFIMSGMTCLLARQLNTGGFLPVLLGGLPGLGISYLKIDKKGMEFNGVITGSENFENSFPESKTAYLKPEEQKFCRLIRSNQITIGLEEIENVINLHVDNIPYNHLRFTFIPFMMRTANGLNSPETKKRLSTTAIHLHNYKTVCSFFYAIKRPYLKVKERILNQECQEIILTIIRPVLPRKLGKIVFNYMNASDYIELDDLPLAPFFDEEEEDEEVDPSLKM